MSNDIANRGEILLYSDENGREFVNVIFEDETFWLTQKAMSELFDCTTDNISRHLKTYLRMVNWTRIQLPRNSR